MYDLHVSWPKGFSSNILTSLLRTQITELAQRLVTKTAGLQHQRNSCWEWTLYLGPSFQSELHYYKGMTEGQTMGWAVRTQYLTVDKALDPSSWGWEMNFLPRQPVSCFWCLSCTWNERVRMSVYVCVQAGVWPESLLRHDRILILKFPQEK